MEAVVERSNLLKALEQVQRNKGAGVDGMTIAKLAPYLKEHWGPCRANRRKPARPLAAQQQPPLWRSPSPMLPSARSACHPSHSASRSIRRTAVYGPVCPVVWEGWRREASPYPDGCHSCLRASAACVVLS